MIRKALFAILVVLFCHVIADAQEGGHDMTSGSPAFRHLTVEINGGLTTYKGDITPILADLGVGWKFNQRFGILAKINYGWLLDNTDKEHRYYNFANLGGEILYTAVASQSDFALDLRGSVTTSVGSQDFKNTQYRAGAYLRIPGRSLGLTLGIGYQYWDSHTSSIPSSNSLFLLLGVTI